MKKFVSKKRYVIPGDVITTSPLRLKENVMLDGKRIMATCTGLSDIFGDSVRVIPLTGMYLPKIDDLVIGKIISVSNSAWFADINSCYEGMLFGQEVFGRGSYPTLDDMRNRLDKGDLIAARIANFDRTREPLITISGQDLGKIDSGELVKISPSKVPRLIGKQGSMIQAIEGATNSSITIGQNGWVIVSNDETNGLLKAIEAIRLVDEQAHVANLTDKVNKMFEFEGVK